jgi:hypothetical protein
MNAKNAKRKETLRWSILTTDGRRRFSSVAVLRPPEKTGSGENGGGEERAVVHRELRGDEDENEEGDGKGCEPSPLK